MKRRITFCALLLAFVFNKASAQEKTITGRIVSSSDTMGIPGVSVVVVGTVIGTSTDINGSYSLKVPSTATKLRFSAISYKNKEVEIGSSSTVDASLEPDVLKIDEVVVTALGVKRESKSLGYASQTVSGEDVSTAKEANFINSLQGKVAGVQISGSGNLGGSSRILLRGVRSINFENQPLFVVDGVPINNGNFATRDQARGALGYDYGNAAQDINPEDIETINVLKGSSATALYGARGANGVIIITTKKGVARTKGEGKSPIGVSVTTGVSLSNVYVLPEYQNTYGGGASDQFIPSTIHPGELRSNFEYDGSWGPKMEGQQVYQWNSYYPSLATYNQKTPWTAHPDNIKDFYETGVGTNNNITLDGGGLNTLYRLSFTNFHEEGTFPNSSIGRHVFSFNGSNKFTDKLTSSIAFNYVRSEGKARPQTGYNGLGSNFTQWWERQLDMKELKDYKNPDGSQRAWNMNSETDPTPLYWDNPYWTSYENYETDQRNRLYGNITLAYELAKGLSISGAVKTDYYTDVRQERVAFGSAVATSISKYSEENITFNENNYELMLNYKTELGKDLDLNALVGTNRQDSKSVDNYATTQGGLKVPNYYSLNNSVDPITSTNSDIIYPVQELRRNSVYASASLGYKRYLYLDLTGRNDWSSTLPADNNSYFYPSATGSFIFSELTHLDWLSYGKIRLGAAQTAIDPSPYVTGETRPIVTDNFNGFATAVIPERANNAELKPEKTTSYEAGAELSFLKGRVFVDFTYYNSTSKDVIFRVQQSAASGFNSKYYNAAEITNNGVELELKGTPVMTKSGFEWGLGVNYAKNNNEVKKLFVDENGKETESVLLQNAPFSATLQARPGLPYGQIVGYDYAYDASGNHIITANGSYARTAKITPLGSYLPDYTGGFTTWVSWKGIKLTGVVDYQKGGKLFSLTNTWGKYSGTLKETAENGIRENGLVLDGVVQNGVDAQGNPTSDGTKNTTNIAAVDHYFLDGGYVITNADVYDASFIKLREVTVTYSFPKKWFKQTPIHGMSLTFAGRNLAILHKDIPHIDPEAALSTDNVQGIEGGQLPSVRTFSGSLNITF